MGLKLSESNTIAIILLPPAKHGSLSGTRMALKWPFSPVRSFSHLSFFQDANTTCSQRPGGCLCASVVSLTICCPVQQRHTRSSEKRSERGSGHNVYMPVWWQGCCRAPAQSTWSLSSGLRHCRHSSTVAILRHKTWRLLPTPVLNKPPCPWKAMGCLLLTMLGDFLAYQRLPLFSHGPIPASLHTVSHCNEDTLFQHEAFLIKQWTKTLFLYKVTFRIPEEWEYIWADVTCIK